MVEGSSITPVDARKFFEAAQRKKKVKATLAELVKQQSTPESRARYAPFIEMPTDITPSDLFDRFMQSSLFRDDVYPEARRQIHALDANEQYRYESSEGEYRSHLAGMAFATLAEGVIAAEESQRGNLVLSGKMALEVCEAIFPNVARIDHAFGQSSLASRPVPDGFIVNANGYITGVLEYKLADRFSWHQLRRYKKLIKDLEGYGIVDAPTLIFVVSAESYLLKKEEFFDTLRALPFRSRQFKRFVTDIINVYQPTEDSGTLADLWERRIYQEEEGETIASDFLRVGRANAATVTELARAGVVFDPNRYFGQRST